MACGDKKASFRAAILDPTLTVTLPAKVTAVTGIDAIAHALETYVTTKRNAASLAFSREAWQLLESNFARVLEYPDDLTARGEMQLGACFAGLAIENSMLGATHALANPLTAEYGIPHGEAIGLMLPHVVRYNGQEYDHWYHELLETTFGSNGDHRRGRAFEVLADRVAALVVKAGLPTCLSQRGVERQRLPQLAADAAKQWTGTFNPRKVGAAELLELYRQAM
jgi:alcohol dehydrogenase